MASGERWIAVDWGTTNLRGYALDRDGRVIERIADPRGILAVAQGGFPAIVAELRARLGDGPMLLAGMVGSNRGWIEAPYALCPVTLDALIAGAARVPDEQAWIVPGASYTGNGRYDVMRGEEVQLLGAVAAGLAPPNGLTCHPGTHAKWARIEDGTLVRFRTAMTGELFSLLRTHSILSPQLDRPVAPDAAFVAGVDRAFQDPGIAAELFAVRARALLAGESPDQASAFTSGLLIGDDVRVGLREASADEPVTLIGDPKLTALYAAAVRRAGRACVEVDGEAALLGGMTAIRERL